MVLVLVLVVILVVNVVVVVVLLLLLLLFPQFFFGLLVRLGCLCQDSKLSAIF